MKKGPTTTIRDFFTTLEQFTDLLNAATRELQRPGRQTAPRDLTFTACLEFAVDRYGIGAIINQRDIERLQEIVHPVEKKTFNLPYREDK